MSALPPGSTIGILGGGQLGRMMAMSAAQLGYHVHTLAPEENIVAAEVSQQTIRSDFKDEAALKQLANACDVISYEFENVPVPPLAAIADDVPLFPNPRALEVAQSRIDEKQFARDCGGVTAPFAVVRSADDLTQAVQEIGTPSILKTNRFGYDGKGQERLSGGEDLVQVWQDMNCKTAILEGFVDFAAEFSVILVRAQDGQVRYWDTPRNEHRDGILARSTVPAGEPITGQVDEARKLARAIAERLDYVGVMTCEFFATADGPVFNEMAPRVHNSGHWTIEGAVTSQFENHIRAITGLPLGDTSLVAPSVEMLNLIGGDVDEWHGVFADPRWKLHLYGKRVSRPGRKMGHVTRLDPA